MSADATGHVYRHAPFTGATLLVLLAIADTVSDQHDNECWMAMTTLSIKARCNRDTARRAVRELTDAGWLEPLVLSAGGRTSRYRFVFDDSRDVVWEGRRATRGNAAGPVAPPTRGPAAGNPRGSRGTPAGEPRGNPTTTGMRTGPVRDVAAERAARRRLGLECAECNGSRYVLTDDPVPTTVPCPMCST